MVSRGGQAMATVTLTPGGGMDQPIPGQSPDRMGGNNRDSDMDINIGIDGRPGQFGSESDMDISIDIGRLNSGGPNSSSFPNNQPNLNLNNSWDGKSFKGNSGFIIEQID
jgi:hypothetical protein